MKATIHVLEDSGYVWDADVAHWLRLECGIVGAMIGGVAAFKQQNAVHGLPLELSPEEVALALERGWGELQPQLRTAELAAALGSGGGGRRKRARQPWEEEEEEEWREGGVDPMDQDGACSGRQQQQDEEPAWRAALTDGASLAIPTTPADAAAVNGSSAAAAAGSGCADAAPQPLWTFPATREERHRYWVFRDLHSKGYRLTGGSKFGADFLLYPGDPTLYHAQFCVRLLSWRQPILPVMLSSATRGSHQARKHLLLASVDEEEESGVEGAAVTTAAAASAAAGTGALNAGAGGAADSAAQQQQQQQQQAGSSGGEAGSNASGGGPIHQQPDGGERLGASSGGVGSRGEHFRIYYTTIGPVEGFGG